MVTTKRCSAGRAMRLRTGASELFLRLVENQTSCALAHALQPYCSCLPMWFLSASINLPSSACFAPYSHELYPRISRVN